MEPSIDFLTKTVTNNNETTKIYEVQVKKITNPTVNGLPIDMPAGELLYSPKRFVLRAGQQQNVKIFYKGEPDHQERYYWLTFIESPAAQLATKENTAATGTQEMKLALQSILVVRGVVAQISQQIMISPAPSDRYTRGFLTGRPRVFSLFIALTYAITSPT
ncbi:fimbria/pilus periplasmic chaperone [Aeromonas salmonicida]|uniref:fimbria/pilus periplasmic chaperone n=1 Tax=Aeromonas salmonicida TaxID=645 RepID=UPI0038CF97C4